jgi:CrcB protein
VLAVSIGGFFGAIGRYYLSSIFNRKSNTANLPVGTLLVNLLGSFLLGILLGAHVAGNIYSLLGIGFMGAFTTFSTLKVELLKMLEKNEQASFIIYLALSYLGGIILAVLGVIAGKSSGIGF